MQLMRLVAWAFDEIRSDRMKRRTLEKGYLLTKFAVRGFRGRELAKVKCGRTLPTARTMESRNGIANNPRGEGVAKFDFV